MELTITVDRPLQQYTLGTWIAALTAVTDQTKPVRFIDDSTAGLLSSYRGYYNHLALDIEPPRGAYFTTGTLRRDAEDALEAEFEGWKGGSFQMDQDTPIWAAPYGDSTGLMVVHLQELDDTCVLLTVKDGLH